MCVVSSIKLVFCFQKHRLDCSAVPIQSSYVLRSKHWLNAASIAQRWAHAGQNMDVRMLLQSYLVVNGRI